MPTARNRAVSAAVGTKVYVIGGQSTNGSITNIVEEYDAITNSWTSKANFPHPLVQAFACSYNGKVYVVGGCTGAASVPDVWEYDPSSNTWTAQSPMPTSRCEISGALINGKIYITSGWLFSYTDLELYDIATNSWSIGTPAPIGLLQTNSGVAFNGKFYAIGGKDYINSIWYDSVMIYDPSVGTWSFGPLLPQGIYAGTAVFYNNKIHYFGGGTAITNSAFNTHYSLAANAAAWQTGVPMPYSLYGATSVNVNGGEINKVYIFGGKDQFDNTQNVTLEYSEPILGISDKNLGHLAINTSYDAFTRELNIQLDEALNGSLYLYNVNGALVKRNSFSGKFYRLNIDGLCNGIYLLKIVAGKANYVQKVVLY